MPSSRKVTERTCLISLAFGLSMAATCLLVMWQRACTPRSYLNGHYYSWNKNDIDSIDRVIEKWRKTHGSLPESLKVLFKSKEIEGTSLFSFEFNDELEMIDGWDNPIDYKIEDDDYELISYGEDGKPGGIWFDSDISNRKPYPPESFAPSLIVFLSNETANGPITLSIFLGVFCSFLSLMLLREEVTPPDATEAGRAKFKKRRVAAMVSDLVKLIVVALFAIGVTIVLGTVYLVHGEFH